MSATPTRCKGLLGRLFGHKFIKLKCDYIYNSQTCYRCGVDR